MPGPRYREVILQGPEGWTQGYVAGYLRGAGLAGGIYDAEREGFDCAPFRERIHDVLDRAAATVHLLVPEEAEPALHAAAQAAADEGKPLRVDISRPVGGARFAFAFTIHSPEHAERIRRDFELPPAGASLLPGASFAITRSSEPPELELKGVDHTYTLHAEGTIAGDVPAVLSLYRRYREEELVRLERLHLLDL